MIEKLRKYLDTSGHGSALLTELSKACMSLNTYGVQFFSTYLVPLSIASYQNY